MAWGRTIGVMLLTLLLTACGSAQPYRYSSDREIPAGPGLLSGPDGEFRLDRNQ